MKQLLLRVTYTAKHGMREKFVDEIISGGLLETILKEDGCISYDYYYSVQNEDEILLVEQWETEEQQKVHLKQPHMEQLRSIKERYIVDMDIKKSLLADRG